MPTREAASAPWAERAGVFRHEELDRLGVPHGVTHRRLGDMKASPARAEAARAAGLDSEIAVLKQAHGAQVLEAGSSPSGATGDGWVSKGAAVGVFAADCLPILAWDRGLTAVGAFHAGWRGLAAGMVEAAVDAFRRLGAAPGSLSAAVGPHIGPCCYRVGEELRPKFRPDSFQERSGGLYLDLAAEASRRLAEAGLDPSAVSISADCTACRSEDFFSWRRDGVRRSQLAFIALPAR